MSEPHDDALLCPVCDYNLTGLPENRCPECGTPFDLEELAAIARGEHQPLWDRAGPALPQVARLWWMALTAPRALARDFPPTPVKQQLVLYTLACYGIAALLFCLGVWFVPYPHGSLRDMLPVAVGIAVGSLFACCICEIFTAIAVSLTMLRTRPRTSYDVWRGFTHCTSGFTVLTALWGVLTRDLKSPLSLGWQSNADLLAWTPAAAVFLWWTTTLCIMIVTRARAGVARWIACLLVPVIGLGAIWLGYWASFIAGVVALILTGGPNHL